MTTTAKAVPILLRKTSAETEILVFRHPLAGVQLVKGSIEAGEAVEGAAIRELCEEAGLCATAVVGDLGVWMNTYASQEWHLQLVRQRHELPDCWDFRTDDGGGLTFSFFWHRLDADGTAEWHPMYREALAVIRARLRDGAPASHDSSVASLSSPTLPVRHSARLLVIDANDQLLLFRYDDGRKPPFWATVGGQLLPGERPEDAASRELAEETGLRDPIGRLVCERHEVFAAGDLPLTQWHQHYFEVRTRGGAIRRDGWTAEERRTIQESRWWSVGELAAATEPVLPAWLPDVFAELLRG